MPKVPMHVASSLMLGLVLGMLYVVAPSWNLIAGVNAAKAAWHVEVVAYFCYAYLFLQAAQYILGGVGTTSRFSLDILASAIPGFILLGVWVSHYVGGPYMSPWVRTIMRMATVTVAFDLIALGSAGALINHLSGARRGVGP